MAGPTEAGEGEATRVVAYDADEEEEAHFGRTFDDFLERKRQCGESTVGLTRDKFLQKLRDNKAALVISTAAAPCASASTSRTARRRSKRRRFASKRAGLLHQQLVGAGFLAGGGGLGGGRGAV